MANLQITARNYLILQIRGILIFFEGHLQVFIVLRYIVSSKPYTTTFQTDSGGGGAEPCLNGKIHYTLWIRVNIFFELLANPSLEDNILFQM